MESVVVEIKKGFAAILSDDGSIVKVKDKNYVIGQKIEIETHRKYFSKKAAICVATFAIMLLGSGAGVWAYTTPYSYVSLDVNPSIKYTLNRFDRVIDVEAVNADGQAILAGLDSSLKNATIEEAIAQTVDQIAEEGYLGELTTPTNTTTITDAYSESDSFSENDDAIDGGIVIAVSNEDESVSNEISDDLTDVLTDVINENVKNPNAVEVEVINVSYERVQEAKALGLTPGKLNLIQKLQESSTNPESIIIEEWKNEPVKKIMKAIKDNRKESDLQEETDSTEPTQATDTQTTNSTQDSKTNADGSNNTANESSDEGNTDDKQKVDSKGTSKQQEDTKGTTKQQKEDSKGSSKQQKSTKDATKQQQKDTKSSAKQQNANINKTSDQQKSGTSSVKKTNTTISNQTQADSVKKNGSNSASSSNDNASGSKKK